MTLFNHWLSLSCSVFGSWFMGLALMQPWQPPFFVNMSGLKCLKGILKSLKQLKVWRGQIFLLVVAACQTHTKLCNGFHWADDRCKIGWADWKRQGPGPNAKIHVCKELIVTGPNHKVISENKWGQKFLAKYMLDDINHHICRGGGAYWRGPWRKSPATIVFDTILTLNVRMVKMKNNHENGDE